MEDVRRRPLARDSSGLMYWYLDYHTTTGTRMYRETPSSLVKLKGKQEQSAPQWEVIGSSIEELREVGEKLRRSKKKPDQDVADLIFDDILPELMDRREADLKRQKQAAKVQSQLNQILPDHGGRSRRERKQINYSYDAYDAAIKAALRSGHDENEGTRATRSMAFHEPRMTAEEEMNAGYRRGRSARAASPPLELPPNRRASKDSQASDLDQPSYPPSNLPSASATDGERTPSRTPTPRPTASQPPSQPASGMTGTAEQVACVGEGRGAEPDPGQGPDVPGSHTEAEPMDIGEDGGDLADVEISGTGSRDGAQEEEYADSSGGSADEGGYVDDPNDANWE